MPFPRRAGTALLFCLAAFACSPRAVFAQQPAATAARAGQVNARTAWDDQYLYLAFQVDDPNIAGTNTAPLSRPEEDDAVGVYLQIGDARPAAPDANSHAMIVSAAGGFTFLRGGEGGKWTPRALRELIPIKYAVTLQGTLNRADDRDQRYTVEMAIPWEIVGVSAPAAGLNLGFNAVVRARNGGFTSAAETVATEKDLAGPAKWTRLTLGGGGGSAAARIVAPRVAGNAPLVNGVLQAGEWSDAGVYAFAAPEKAAPVAAVAVPAATPGAPAATALPPLPSAERPLALERLLMARYVLQFQGDPRKLTTFRGVRNASGRFLMSDQPALGAGPWFSSDRPGWFRRDLTEMRRLGVDVALTVVGGPDGENGAADEKALLVMVGALRDMARERLAAPQVALWLDTRALTAGGSPGPDLSTEAGRAALYRAVKRYFQIVPAELRARVQLPVELGGVPAFPVFLSSASGFARLDPGFVEDLRRRYAAEFGAGTTIIVAGGEDFAESGARFAAYLTAETSGKGFGPVSSFVVQPGYDNGAVARRGAAAVQPRRGGETYRKSWEAALAAKPTWLLLDSWNDFARGTEVAPSRQYGPQYVDMTRLQALLFNGLQPRDIKWLAHDAPRRMRPEQIVSVDVLLQNAGATPLRSPLARPTPASAAAPGAAPAAAPATPRPRGAALAYRWLRSGQVVAEGPLRLPLIAPVFPTQVVRLPIGVAAVRADEKTGKLVGLPPGEYVVQIDMTETGEDNKPVWFGENGDTPLSIPVTVTENAAEGVNFEGTSTPPLLQSGQTYPVDVRLRWMGERPLAPGEAALTWQLLALEGDETVATGSVPLARVLPPGQSVTLRTDLRLADNGGNALPAAFPETRGGGYRLRWLLTRTQATEAIPGVFSERVALYTEDHDALVLPPDKMPGTLDAESLTTMDVTVVNRGLTKWTKGSLQVGYHWFFPDGVEAVWKGVISTPIPRDVEPGKSVKVSVPVRAPERDGEYVLAFDLTRGTDNWLSTQPLTRAGDLGLAYVRVRGGRLTFVDLSKDYNTDAVAPESAPGDGDLDGNGRSIPAESFPPDRFGLVTDDATGRGKNLPRPAYPSGYYADVSRSARLISFRYGSQADGAKNVVTASGQTLAIPRGRYTGLHLAAATTGGRDREVALVLRYKDGTSETVTRVVGDWNRPPTEREAVAVMTHRLRTEDGDVAGTACVVRHVIVPVALGKELVSVSLPNDPAVKVFAITLEK